MAHKTVAKHRSIFDAFGVTDSPRSGAGEPSGGLMSMPSVGVIVFHFCLEHLSLIAKTSMTKLGLFLTCNTNALATALGLYSI